MDFEFGYKTVDLFNCKIVEGTRNFAGNEKKDRNTGRVRNNEGNRNFLIELDPDVYEEFKERGWNVGRFAAREDGVEPKGFMRITVSYFKQPPIIHLISDGIDTPVGENRIHMLDSVNILNMDMRCTAVNKQNKDGEWKKYAYVDEMWVEITPDRFARKYANLRHANEDED